MVSSRRVRLNIVFNLIFCFILAKDSDKYVLLHQGCYSEVKAVTKEMKWEQCQEMCFDNSFMFASVKVKVTN